MLQKKEEARQAKMIKQQNDHKKKQNEFRMEQENRMKNQIGLQGKRLASMKIEEEKRRRLVGAKREHEERCLEEEQLRNIKMEEVA